MLKTKDGALDKKKFEVTKEEAIKLNKGLAKIRKKTIAEQEEETLKKIKRKLKQPTLLIDTIKEVKKEVAGEEDTILSVIIVASTRLVKNAIPESANLLLSDKTGLGKDWVIKNTLKVILSEEEHIHVTKMSAEAFTYWHYKDENWIWNGKVIHFEDITQSLLNTPTFKTMASGDNYAVIVKDQKTLEIPIPGKPCMILTSHHANPKDEAFRRFRIGGLNDSKEQTRNIMDKISKRYTGNTKTENDYITRSAVQSIEPYEVIIPFAEIIQHYFPDNDLMRTHYRCFLDYICASAVFHQYQRRKTKDGNLIATLDDYMIARMVLIYTTSNPNMVPLSKEYRDIIKILQESEGSLTVKQLEVNCPYSQRWLYKHLPRLISTGLIEKGSEYKEDAKKSVMTYKYADITSKMIPLLEELSSQIINILDKTNKTFKTKSYQQLKNWFCTVDAKLTKQDVLVLHGVEIPLNRRILHVFTVLSEFLRNQDEKRYSKYFEERDLTKIKNEDQQQNLDSVIKNKPDLKTKVQELKNFIEKIESGGFKVSYIALCDNFDKSFIEKCKQEKILIPLPNGNYGFGGI